MKNTQSKLVQTLAQYPQSCFWRELPILPIPLFVQPVTSTVQASSSEKENSGDVRELPVLFLENFISFLIPCLHNPLHQPSRPASLRRKIQAMSRSFFLMGLSCGSIAIMKLSLTITTTKLDLSSGVSTVPLWPLAYGKVVLLHSFLVSAYLVPLKLL
jgi:hypothetical protein